MANRMYSEYFGIRENAFSITPDPRYLYMSERHREAFAHLLYGVVESGGFVQLTGEVGTGKTTVCRAVLERLPDNVDVALLLNPPVTPRELLLAIIAELRIPLPISAQSLQELVRRLNEHLLENHAAGRRTVVIIDEAQTIKPEILEQVRLLTNLETPTAKLLQVFLIGQPELREKLTHRSLRQVAQRITARYHLEPLDQRETEDYVKHRLAVAGCRQGLFFDSALRQLYLESQGIPRVINILCDRALLGAYANDQEQVDAKAVRSAARQWRGQDSRHGRRRGWLPVAGVGVGIGVLLLAGAAVLAYQPTGHVAVRLAATAAATELVTPHVPALPAPEVVEVSAKPDGLEAAEVTTVHALQEVLPTMHTGSEALYHAERTLLSIWLRDATPDATGSLCDVAARSGLRCGRGVGGVATLRRYNRPALVTLVQPEGASSYATLTAIDGDTLTLQAEQTTVHTSAEDLARYWNGEFLLLWRPPLDGIQLIGAEAPPHAVLWLRQALDSVEGRVTPDRYHVKFDTALQHRLKRFQARHGLRADGVAGVQTLTHLITLLGEPPSPVLYQKQPLS